MAERETSVPVQRREGRKTPGGGLSVPANTPRIGQADPWGCPELLAQGDTYLEAVRVRSIQGLPPCCHVRLA